MTAAEFCQRHQVRFEKKSTLRLMRWVAWFLSCFPKVNDGECRGERFMTAFWTTYRLPFGQVIIAHPDWVDPMMDRWEWLRQHELVHAYGMRSTCGLLWHALMLVLFPLPAFLSGRWYIERWAMLIDIRAGKRTVAEETELLWREYLWPWPREWAARWWQWALEHQLSRTPWTGFLT